MELQGGFGKEVSQFLLELERRKMQGACSIGKAPKSIANLDLLIALSIELQRLNSEMILQRQPTNEALEVRDLTRLKSAQLSALLDARKGLNARNMRAAGSCHKDSILALTSICQKSCQNSPNLSSPTQIQDQGAKSEPMTNCTIDPTTNRNRSWADIMSSEDENAHEDIHSLKMEDTFL